MTVEMSDLNRLEADLLAAGALAGARILDIVEEWGADVEDEAKHLAPRKGLQHYADTITHDVHVDGATIVGEAGPDREINGQAKLGHLFEYGTERLAPRAHMGPAHDRATPVAVRKIEDVGGDIL